jgi:hypothetical protein
VIRFDKRGTGLSDPTDTLPGMDQQAVDLAAVMRWRAIRREPRA